MPLRPFTEAFAIYTTKKRIDSTMEQPDVLVTFRGFSRSFYIYSAALEILIDAMVIYLLVAQKFQRNVIKFNPAMLFSLALCDIFYEAATTTLFLQSDSCEVAEKCKMLYFIYLSLNLCTLFHIVAEIVGKMIHRVFASGVFWSVCAWLSAFVVACVDLKNNNGFIDVRSMMSLGSFKTFGHVLFDVIFCSGVFVMLLTFCFTKRNKKAPVEKFKAAQQEACQDPLNSRMATTDDVLLSSIFMVFLVGWYAWVVIGVDSSILMAIEVMKSFEVIRLGARILNPVIILYLYIYGGTLRDGINRENIKR